MIRTETEKNFTGATNERHISRKQSLLNWLILFASGRRRDKLLVGS